MTKHLLVLKYYRVYSTIAPMTSTCKASTSYQGRLPYEEAKSADDLNFIANRQTLYDLYGGFICIALAIKFGFSNPELIRCLQPEGQKYYDCPQIRK